MRSCLLLLACVLACGSKTEFDGASEFQLAMKEEGWVPLGAFGEVVWPARIVEDRRARDAISFRAPDGTPREYNGFGGYELRLLRLEGKGGTRAAMVYRSRNRR